MDTTPAKTPSPEMDTATGAGMAMGPATGMVVGTGTGMSTMARSWPRWSISTPRYSGTT